MTKSVLCEVECVLCRNKEEVKTDDITELYKEEVVAKILNSVEPGSIVTFAELKKSSNAGFILEAIGYKSFPAKGLTFPCCGPCFEKYEFDIVSDSQEEVTDSQEELTDSQETTAQERELGEDFTLKCDYCTFSKYFTAEEVLEELQGVPADCSLTTREVIDCLCPAADFEKIHLSWEEGYKLQCPTCRLPEADKVSVKCIDCTNTVSLSKTEYDDCMFNTAEFDYSETFTTFEKYGWACCFTCDKPVCNRCEVLQTEVGEPTVYFCKTCANISCPRCEKVLECTAAERKVFDKDDVEKEQLVLQKYSWGLCYECADKFCNNCIKYSRYNEESFCIECYLAL